MKINVKFEIDCGNVFEEFGEFEVLLKQRIREEMIDHLKKTGKIDKLVYERIGKLLEDLNA